MALPFASLSTLAKQIENGVPADAFLSADAGLIEEATRANLLGNRIVFIVPASSAVQTLTVDPSLNLKEILGKDGLLSVGDPAHVPVGKYARAALENLNLWPQVKKRLAPSQGCARWSCTG